MVLPLKNPVRRPLVWKFYVHQDFSDIFLVKGPSSGTLAPRKSLDILIEFKPAFPVEFTTKAYLETDQGNFIIDLSGACISPKIDASETNKDFGIIGIGHAEFREIVVTNPTGLPLPVRAVCNNPVFEIDIK